MTSLNDVVCPYLRHWALYEKNSFKIPSFDDKQLQPWSKFHKKQVKVLKTMQMSQKLNFP